MDRLSKRSEVRSASRRVLRSKPKPTAKGAALTIEFPPDLFMRLRAMAEASELELPTLVRSACEHLLAEVKAFEESERRRER